MALLAQKNVGGITVTPAYASVSEKDIEIGNTSAVPGTYETEVLATVGLPNIVFMLKEDSAAGSSFTTSSASVTFSAAVRTINGEPDFFKIDQILFPASGVPGLFSFEFPAIAIRATIQAPEGTSSFFFRYVLSAYGP